MSAGLWLFGLIAASLVRTGGGAWRLPVDSMGRPCDWPFDPLLMAGMPIGMYHCPSCGEMVVAGIPHPDYSEVNQ